MDDLLTYSPLFIFAAAVMIGVQLNRIEEEIRKLQGDLIELEKSVSQSDFDHDRSMRFQLDYIEKRVADAADGVADLRVMQENQ